MSDAPERHLFVPMNVEALLIGASPRTDWVDPSPDFGGVPLNRFLGRHLETDACSTMDGGLNAQPGVHLHWALPDGLTHGVAREPGQAPEFPSIPNRWLVVRLWDQTATNAASPLQSRAWIVESDTIAGDDSGVVWPRGSRDDRAPSHQERYVVRLGRRFELALWPGETSPPAPPIVDVTAMGYGDPSFTAFYPASRAMLGFHDHELKDVANARLTYVVAGWYADLDRDPLHRAVATNSTEALDTFLRHAQWIYPRDVASLPPRRIICHGVVAGIQWRTIDTPYESGIPRRTPFAVAVGNTGVEALAALFQAQLQPGVATLLEAFQYDLLAELETPGGDHAFEHKLHERRYRPLSRGIRWDLLQNTGLAADAQSTPPIPGDIRVPLERVNARQRKINRLKRARDSKTSELYAIWYKKVLYAGAAGLATAIADLQDDIRRLSEAIAELEHPTEHRPAGEDWDALHEGLRTLAPGYRVEAVDDVRFWRPNDPVVLLAGQAFQRVFRHGEDGRYRSDGRLLCRTSGQEVTSITISIPDGTVPQVRLGPADVDRWAEPLPEPVSTHLPADVRESLRRVFHEALLLTLDLDPVRSRDVAAAAHAMNESGIAGARPQAVDELAAALMRDVEQRMRAAERPAGGDGQPPPEDPAGGGRAFRWDGVWPSPITINAWRSNPWLPLFLQWQATWTPTYAETRRALETWTLNEVGTTFVEHRGVAGPAQVYGGTTLLTPAAATHFGERLRQYNLAHDNAELRTLQTAVRSMSLLCQTLGGLTDNLLSRKGRPELPPLEPGADGPHPSPISPWVQGVDWLSPLTDSEFFPVRAGHLRLEKLWVVDAFGQLLQLEAEDADTVTRLRKHERLGTDPDLVLEPRLAQAARLDLEWVPATRPGVPPAIEPLPDDTDPDPVCGWIIPNRLDRGLMIYDARGHPLGALQAVQRKSWTRDDGQQETFHWVDFPGSTSFFFGRPTRRIADPLGPDANPHLREYVNALLALTEGSGAELLDRLDQAQSTGGSTASPRQSGLSLLIGRPLALVRATLRLELDGEPARAQGWAAARTDDKARTGGVERLRVPIRLGDRRHWNELWLGDDGLVGFFLNQDYRHFFPAYGLVGTDDSYIAYRHAPEVSIDTPLDLTLLMDPARGVVATSGILPRTSFTVPYGDVAEVLDSKEVIFFTGPLVTTPAAIRMPQPSDLYGQWSWTHHPAEVWLEEPITDTRKEEGRVFDDLQIADGWLKLVTDPVAIRAFTVQVMDPVEKRWRSLPTSGGASHAQVAVPPGTDVLLSWAVVGAERIELKEEDQSLVVSTRHPLPAQCRVRISRNTSFTLIATGRGEQPAGGGTSTTRTIDITTAATA